MLRHPIAGPLLIIAIASAVAMGISLPAAGAPLWAAITLIVLIPGVGYGIVGLILARTCTPKII